MLRNHIYVYIYILNAATAAAASFFLLYTSLQEEETTPRQREMYPTEQEDTVSLWKHRCDFLQEQTRLLSLEFQPQRVPLSQTAWFDLLIEMEQLTGDLEQMATRVSLENKRPLPAPLPRHRFFHNIHHVVIATVIVFVIISFIWTFSSSERLI